ncbi:hypothetical protein Aple_050170 [Acrocarpospora pleiomorpha]|uniref:EamA domain-containing protein n=1 Tax=Acrocarpospora pleiomorpha TaxID=90975 RepID=A0A5M3XMD8_9ACTN|nr:DMT family transporter [Acrocarpospora pleiomorpha]GES22120.1 hypothetical protein Aple_050170 [Acrocarpospora pleiomorpha]
MTTDIKTAHAPDLQAVAMAAGAMFMVGTLAAVSDVIQDYPLYGGQAIRYAVAALVLFATANAMDAKRAREAGRRTRALNRMNRSRVLSPLSGAVNAGDSSHRTGAKSDRRILSVGPNGADQARVNAALLARDLSGQTQANDAGQARVDAARPAQGLSGQTHANADGRAYTDAAPGGRNGDVRVRLTARDRVLLVLLSLTGLVIFNICVIESARHAGPALVGTVLGTVPLALALCAPIPAMLSRVRPTPPSRRILIAAAVVVAGATLATGLGSGTPAALLWALGALVCEVCFSLLALPLLPKLGAIRVSAYSSALAVPSLLVLGVVFDGSGILRVPTLAEALGLGYLALIVTTGFLLWYSALPRLGPGKAGLFAGMIPVGAIGTGVVLGLGVPSVADLAGAALVIVGILLGLRPERGVVQ